jgi:hypothetical protein
MDSGERLVVGCGCGRGAIVREPAEQAIECLARHELSFRTCGLCIPSNGD